MRLFLEFFFFFLFPLKALKGSTYALVWPVADCPPSREEEKEVDETEDESYCDTPCVVRAACPPD